MTEHFVTALGPNDVLMGRGVSVNRYDGNKILRKIVMQRQDEYVRCTKRHEKHDVAMEIVETVKANGGRFLRKVEEEAEEDKGYDKGDKDNLRVRKNQGAIKWQVVTNQREIISKVKQLIRDMGPEALEKRGNRRRNHPEVRLDGRTTAPPIKMKPDPVMVDVNKATKISSAKGVSVSSAKGVSGSSLGPRETPLQRVVKYQPQEEKQQPSHGPRPRRLPPLQEHRMHQRHGQLRVGVPVHSSTKGHPAQDDTEMLQPQPTMNRGDLPVPPNTCLGQARPCHTVPFPHLLGLPEQYIIPIDMGSVHATSILRLQQQQQRQHAVRTDPWVGLFRSNQMHPQTLTGSLSSLDQSIWESLLMRDRHDHHQQRQQLLLSIHTPYILQQQNLGRVSSYHEGRRWGNR